MARVAFNSATFFVLEQPEDLGAKRALIKDTGRLLCGSGHSTAIEEQTSWRLDNAPWEPALAWVPNYVSVGEHKDFVKAKFEEDVAEGLNTKTRTLVA